MTVPQPDIFEQVKKHALAGYPGLLQEWAPGGKIEGPEYKALNPTRADRKIKSFSINIKTGAWGDFATGDMGTDPIGLYAYIFCGGTEKAHRIEACKKMAVEFGIEPGEAPVRRAKVRPQLRVVKNEDPETWKPEVPAPEGETYDREAGGWDHLYEYRDQSGRLLRYVGRRDAKGNTDKYIRPITYGVLNGKEGWFLKSPDAPRSLYGLERLDNAPVLLQEGEKKTDAVKLLLTEYACLSLTGGAGNRNCNDLEPLRGRRVIYCPDNDPDGRKTANAIAEKLAAMGCAVLVVDVFSHEFAAKWDLGNAVADGWDADRLRAFVKDNAHPFDPDPGAVDELEDGGEDPGDDDDKQDSGGWIVPLGHAHGTFYYLARRSGEVYSLTPDQHTSRKLMALADLRKFWEKTRFKNDKGGISWERAANFLMRACEKVGRFRIDTVRGRGAWIDRHIHTGEDRTVLHLGDILLVNGVAQGLELAGSRHVYERRESIKETFGRALKSSEANELVKLCQGLRWEKPVNAKLMAGWIVCSLVCGALPWRPSVWITGGSGAGKTTLLQDIVEPVLGGLKCPLASHSTEAGVRQGLDGDALAVLFDEAEAESVHDRHRMQGVFDLVRQSSKEGSAPIVKGTQAQTGAKSYTLRSTFLFSSINVSMNKLADESRITVLGLETTPKGDMKARAQYAELRQQIHATLTPEFRAGLLARIVTLMPTIKENVRTFSEAAAEHFGSNRAGDQIGAMLAGFYALFSSKEITLDEARTFVEAQEWEDANSAEVETDEQRLLGHILQQNVTVKAGGSPYDVNIGGLILAAADLDKTISVDAAVRFLLDRGIKFDGKAGGVWIANRHVALEAMLKDTPWSVNWHRALKRLDGAQDSGKSVWFGAGAVQRAVFVPVNLTPLTDC